MHSNQEVDSNECKAFKKIVSDRNDRIVRLPSTTAKRLILNRLGMAGEVLL